MGNIFLGVLLMGATNLVIVEGPELKQLLLAFENACSKEESAYVVFKTLCSKATESDSSKYRIIGLTHEDGSGSGFKFFGFHGLTGVRVKGYYNCRNNHGYMIVGEDSKE